MKRVADPAENAEVVASRASQLDTEAIVAVDDGR
jgi:hypothetical protein